MSKLTPVLSASWDQADSFTIEGYKRNGGYTAISKALAMQPDEVIQLIKDSGLRGRGGAGFPTGNKWGFIPQGDNKEHYFVVNADESEPGTCKDTPLMSKVPKKMPPMVAITVSCTLKTKPPTTNFCKMSQLMKVRSNPMVSAPPQCLQR